MARFFSRLIRRAPRTEQSEFNLDLIRGKTGRRSIDGDRRARWRKGGGAEGGDSFESNGHATAYFRRAKLAGTTRAGGVAPPAT